MAIVFGIEGVPVFELLIVITFLLFAGLIMVILEVTKLRKLMEVERKDIIEFENDLTKFEINTKQKAPHAELVQKIVEARQKGFSESQIFHSMNAIGWEKTQIQQAMQSASDYADQVSTTESADPVPQEA